MPTASRDRRSSVSEKLIFGSATAVALLHALDDAFVNRQPRVGADQHLLAALIAVALGALAFFAFPRVRPGLRSLLAAIYGVLALANGAQHVIHIGADAPARSDVTGVLAAIAGVALVALAIWVPFRHRGEGAHPRKALAQSRRGDRRGGRSRLRGRHAGRVRPRLDAEVPGADRGATERRLPAGDVRGERRAEAVGLVRAL